MSDNSETTTPDVPGAPINTISDQGTREPPVPSVAVKRLSYDANTAIDKYVQLRDKVAEIKERHKQELAAYNAAMESLEGHLLAVLEETGADNIKSSAGTAYKSTLTSAVVREWHKTLAFIQEHDAWELLEARVNKTMVETMLQETGAIPPGVVITQRINLNVRRA